MATPEQSPPRRIGGGLRAGCCLVVALAAAGCAQQGQRQQGATDADPCNPVVGAVIGGVAGALLGGDRRRERGALIGAGVGALACVAYNYKTAQTRTAQQVGDEYRKANNNQLPPAPVVNVYRTETTRATARGGDEVTVNSSIEVVPGAKEPLRELREEFVILDPKGVERSRIAKTPTQAGTAGGAFVSTLQFTFPQGVPAGDYEVQSRLFVNGTQARASSVKIQVTRLDTRLRLAAADASAPAARP
jgi:hypothetical protein